MCINALRLIPRGVFYCGSSISGWLVKDTKLGYVLRVSYDEWVVVLGSLQAGVIYILCHHYAGGSPVDSCLGFCLSSFAFTVIKPQSDIRSLSLGLVSREGSERTTWDGILIILESYLYLLGAVSQDSQIRKISVSFLCLFVLPPICWMDCIFGWFLCFLFQLNLKLQCEIQNEIDPLLSRTKRTSLTVGLGHSANAWNERRGFTGL